jgi:uncharacterized protein YjlB
MGTPADTEHLRRSAPTVTALWFDERGFVPNNPRLPALIYAQAFARNAEDLTAAMESRFTENGWPSQWRDGIYDFHHFHSLGHEVLGIARGHALLALGGEGGAEIEVGQGDVVLLPAGTGHRRLNGSPDLLVIGAYPPGQPGDIRREAVTPEVRQRMVRLSFPPSDPVAGVDGPLLRLWADTVKRPAPDSSQLDRTST